MIATKTTLRCALAFLAPLTTLCACGGESAPSQDMAVATVHNFQQINEEILQPSCGAFSVCHSPSGKQMANKLDVKGTADVAYAALFAVASVNPQAKSEGLLLVKPCDPENSFLLKKLSLPITQIDPKVGYGGAMPSANPALPPAQLEAIRAWIARGAHRTEAADVSGSTCTVEDMGTAPSDGGLPQG